MTAPDRPRPTVAYIGTSGSQKVSGVQNESEAQIKAAGRAEADAAMGEARGNQKNNMFGGFGNGLIGFISFLVYALKGVTGGLIDLTGILSDTQNTANNAAETAAAASNLAVLYNFDVAASREKYPAAAPFSFPTPSYAFSGSNVALLQPEVGYPANATLRLGPDFRVTPEEKIYVEWRQRRVGANFQARPVISIRDSAGTVIDAEPAIMAGTPAVPVQPLVTATDNAWAKYSGVITIPVGAYTAVPELRLQSAAGLTLTGAWAFDNVIVRRAVEADLTAIQAELAGKANYSDIPTNVPLWQNINPNDDPVFPMSSLVFQTAVSGGNGSSASGSETKNPTFSTSSGDMYFGYIRALRDREYTQIGFMTAKGGIVGSGPFEMWLHLYKMDPTTGTLSLLWNSGNIKSTVQAAGSGKMVRFAMPQIHAAQGDVFAAGIVQRANIINPSYSIYGLTMPYTDQPAGVYPRGLASRSSVGTTFPSPATIASGSQVWTDENIPWFVLG